MKVFVALFAALLIVVVAGITFISWMSFKGGCEDYLKLAADAPSVERADAFLEKAISYIESHGLTTGNSALFFKNPGQDLGIWYGQIKGAQMTTRSILQRDRRKPGSVSQLERDNALMKIREVILDQGKESAKVTAPDNAWLYPYQGLFWGMWIFTSLLGIIVSVSFGIDHDY